MLNLDPNWRRTVLALTFASSSLPLAALTVWLASGILTGAWPSALAAQRLAILGTALHASLALIALVLTGLSFTVALRQVSAKFAGGELVARGGDASGADMPGDDA